MHFRLEFSPALGLLSDSSALPTFTFLLAYYLPALLLCAPLKRTRCYCLFYPYCVLFWPFRYVNLLATSSVAIIAYAIILLPVVPESRLKIFSRHMI